MKICTNCGRECSDDTKICPKCGWGLKDAKTVKPSFENVEIIQKEDKVVVKKKRKEKSYSDTEKSASRLGFLLCWILPSLLGGNLIYFVSVWELLKNIVWCFTAPLIIGLMCYKPRSYERTAFIKMWVLSLVIQVIAIVIAILVVRT